MELLQHEAALQESLKSADNAEERARLIKESEVKLAQMAARAAVAKGKADEDLQRRIAGKQPSSLRPHTLVAYGRIHLQLLV